MDGNALYENVREYVLHGYVPHGYGNDHDQYENEIWDCLTSCAEDCGMTVPEFLDTIKCTMGSIDSLKNDLVWLAVERICEDLEREKEEAA